jgi:16S rRNA G966 N2-methylase RsmD
MYKILLKNTNSHNFTYNCSYNWVKFMLKQDVIYLDPPWGGNEYKNKDKIDLYLDEINVIDIINQMYNFTKIIVLKVPNNFNLTRIDTSFWLSKIFNITKNRKNLYKLIIFHKMA